MLQAEAGLIVPFGIAFWVVMKELSTTHRKLGQKIKFLRKQLDMTQEDLAFKIGVDRSYMGFVERGEKNPTLKNLIKIAKALKVTLSELFKSIK
jgi:DNA-binding XRE family transcriptional regulator